MDSQALATLQPGTIAIVGVPFDENSSFLRGPALAPPRIREALHSGASNLSAENGIDLGAEPRLLDLGDLEFAGGVAAFEQIEQAIAAVLERGACALALGGDHSITYPAVRACAARYGRLNILHLDAHPDLYDELDGNRYSHACPFARILEENLAVRLVQVGIRTLNPHQRAQAVRFGVEIFEARHWQPGFRVKFDTPVYLSLDMDVLDPAFAPGVSHHEPGGPSTRDVIGLIQGLRVPILGADIVEFNPRCDPLGITAAAAAKLLKEIAACMLEWNPKGGIAPGTDQTQPSVFLLEER
jgi:arginase